MAELVDWDPMSEESRQDPVGTDRRMRQRCPVAYSDAYGGFFAVFRHEDIVMVTKDHETFASTPAFSVPDMPPDEPPWVPLQADLPRHRLYRKVLVPFFMASRVQIFEPQLREMTNELIDRFIGRGEADFAAELCLELPALALCMLLGVPADDAPLLTKWTYDSIEATANGDNARKGEIHAKMRAYGAEWLERRRNEPGDDLISAMLKAEIDGQPMTGEELAGMFMLVAKAGHETTANALITALHHLAEDPSQRAWLRAQPELPAGALEELVRYTAPVRVLARTAKRDVVIRDRLVPAGSRVALMFASGSRDEEVFEKPDECRFDRDARNHTTFGKGIHRCLGEHLARLEIKVVLKEVLRRIPDFELAGPPEPAMWPNTGYHTLPVKFPPQPIS